MASTVIVMMALSPEIKFLQGQFVPIVQPKLNTGKEPFKCGIRIAYFQSETPHVVSYGFPSSPSLVRLAL
jgi:hypothetical protein